MRIIPVDTRKTERTFLDFPRKLYRNDPNHVMPFDAEIKRAFDRELNPHFRNGDAARWIAVNEQDRTVGRIAAFHDSSGEPEEGLKTGGCGYFESVDDRMVSHLLFSTAGDWLQQKGFDAMIGPVNFGENETNWGCLVHGFVPQGLGMTYNLPYYRDLFERYGFHIFYRQFSFHMDLDRPFPERFWKIAEWINQREGYSFRHYDPARTKKFVDDTVTIYNQAWEPLKSDFTPMDPASLYNELKKLQPIMDPELVWFAYYRDEPIAFFLFLPDANQIFRHLNGKLHLFNKLRFLYYKRRNTMTRIRGSAAGVVPKYQNSGVESGIFWQLKQVMEKKPHYRQFELSWVGDYNPKMISLYKATGAYHAKTHHTYMYLFDRDRPFKRYMEEAVDPKMLPDEVPAGS